MSLSLYICIYTYTYAYKYTDIHRILRLNAVPWLCCVRLAGAWLPATVKYFSPLQYLQSRSQWPLACWDCGFESHRGAWMCVCCWCCVLSGGDLCDELITHPGESYRLWCVVVCDQETSRMRRPWPALGRSATGKKTVHIDQLCDVSSLRYSELRRNCPEG